MLKINHHTLVELFRHCNGEVNDISLIDSFYHALWLDVALLVKFRWYCNHAASLFYWNQSLICKSFAFLNKDLIWEPEG
jgi:hypothetical protein